MRTSELKKAALDWAVAKSWGVMVYPSKQGRWLTKNYGEFNHRHGTPWWNPSTNWAQGGTIIERERLSLWFCDSVIDAETDEVVRCETWYAETFEGEHGVTGQTALIAAMRCYVASKLGDEVQIPAELTL